MFVLSSVIQNHQKQTQSTITKQGLNKDSKCKIGLKMFNSTDSLITLKLKLKRVKLKNQTPYLGLQEAQGNDSEMLINFKNSLHRITARFKTLQVTRGQLECQVIWKTENSENFIWLIPKAKPKIRCR